MTATPETARDLFRVDNTDDAFELYVSVLSTAECLAVLPDDAKTKIEEFSGEWLRGAWVGLDDLPPLRTVSELRTHLLQNEDLCITDITVRIDGLGQLSSHDDGEVSMVFGTPEERDRTMESLMPEGEELRARVYSNPGKYVHMTPHGIDVYDEFDDYLRAVGLI